MTEIQLQEYWQYAPTWTVTLFVGKDGRILYLNASDAPIVEAEMKKQNVQGTWSYRTEGDHDE